MFNLIKEIKYNNLCWTIKNHIYPYCELTENEIKLIEIMWNKSNYNFENQPISSIYLVDGKLEVVTGRYYGKCLLNVPFLSTKIPTNLKNKYCLELLELFLKFKPNDIIIEKEGV